MRYFARLLGGGFKLISDGVLAISDLGMVMLNSFQHLTVRP